MSMRVVEFSEYDIVVPFVCHWCGNCCRDFYPGIEVDMLPEIAGLTGRPIHEIQARLSEDCDAHNAGRPTDCFFLEPGTSRCLIHEIRPDGCRLFPTLTKTGLGKVDCPGCREFEKALRVLSGHENNAAAHKATHLKKPRPIPEAQWEPTLKKLAAAKSSRLLIQELVARNGMRHE
jgi:Fe-S-cluster containining protein